MSKLRIRSSRQFILVFGAVCALILTPVNLMVYWLARQMLNSAYLASLLVGATLIASLILATLAAFLLVRFLNQLISTVRATVPEEEPPPLPRRELGAQLNEMDRLIKQIVSDLSLLRDRNRALRALTTINHALNRAAPADMLDEVLEHTADLVPYRRAYIALLDEQTGAFRVRANIGYMPEEIEHLTVDVTDVEQDRDQVNLPLRTPSAVVGIFHLEAQPPDADVWHLLHLLAEILAGAIEKRRLYEAADREVRAQALLNEAGRVLTSTLDKQEVLTRIMREVIEVLNAAAGSVLLVDEARGDMYFAAAASPRADLLLGTRMPLDQGIVGWTVQNRQPVFVADAHQDPRFYGLIDQQTGLNTRSVLCVPLLSKERMIGAIEVIDPRPGQFTERDLRVLESLAPQAAIAIDNASLHESIKAQMVELERTQDQLLQAEKLSAIGQLVAGVAHELNNPLTAIVGYSQLLLETCEDRQICDDLERIEREAQRSARIVQNLLSFARQTRLEKHPIDLADVVNKTVDLLTYQLEVDNIRVLRDVPSAPVMVLGDRYQLQQVFLNLISNAHQAMRKAHGGGTLFVQLVLTEDELAQVRVADDGPGISKENMGRIFDPFFTTKDVGEGTGLGLSICLGIVQEHQGEIRAESEDGKGAAFTVELPLYSGPLEEDQVPTVAAYPLPIQAQSILVIDDEVEIVQLLKRILEAEGHHVTTVENGLQAQDALSAQMFDLVICDLKMPGMSGSELYDQLKQTQPEQARKFIFSTGDVVSNESWGFLQSAGNRFISKPFKPEQILALVREGAD